MPKVMAVVLSLLLFSTLSFTEKENSGNGSGNNSGGNPGHSGEAPNPAKPGNDDSDGPVRIGWAIVTPLALTTSGGSNGLVVFATLGLKHGDETAQSGLLPSALTTNSLVYASTSGKLSRNIGIGIVNPNNAAANLTMTLHDEDGSVIGTPKHFSLLSGHQTAQFLTALYADKPEVPHDLTGTLNVTSDLPVSIIGLRFRGSNFSVLPVTNLSTPAGVPTYGAGIGGLGAVLVPDFATGGGWATELVLINTGTGPLTLRADFFAPDGTALTVRLNGESKSSFTGLVVPAGGVLELAPKTNEGHSPF